MNDSHRVITKAHVAGFTRGVRFLCGSVGHVAGSDVPFCVVG